MKTFKLTLTIFFLAVAITACAQTNPSAFNKIKITGATKSNGATRMVVQDSITKEYHWVLKSSLVSPTAPTLQQVATAGSSVTFPAETDGIYSTINDTDGAKSAIRGTAYNLGKGVTGTNLNYGVGVSGYSSEGIGGFFQNNAQDGTEAFVATTNNYTNPSVGNKYIARFTNINTHAYVTQDAYFKGTGFKTNTGTSSQFLKADGSVDSNQYQTVIANPITGTGTTNYLPKFTGTSTLGNSSINEVSSRVLLGATDNTVDKLQVNGSILGTTVKAPLVTSTTDLLTLTAGGTEVTLDDTNSTLTVNADVVATNIKRAGDTNANILLAGGGVTALSGFISTETDPLALKLSNNLSDLTNTTTARTNLGLGTLATQDGIFSEKINKNVTITGNTKTKITYDTNGLVTSGTDLVSGDIPDIAQSQVTNLVSDLALKAPLSSLTNTQNFLVKYALTGQTPSRVSDTGTYIGIGTVNTPTKDLTFGNQGDREIGVENSNNTNNGKDLSISASSTINYVDNSNFVELLETPRKYNYSCATTTNNIYVAVSGGGAGSIYMQTNESGAFNNVGFNAAWTSMCAHQNGNVYSATGSNAYMQTAGVGSFNLLQTIGFTAMCVKSNGDVYGLNGNTIYIQTAGSGSFIASAITMPASPTGLATHPNGDIYMSYNGGIAKQTAGAGNFVAISSPSLAFVSIACSPTNSNVYAGVNDNGVYVQNAAIGSFTRISTIAYLPESISVAPTGNVYVTSKFTADFQQGRIYMQQNNSEGTANLDGGTLSIKAGTGKGTGSSNVEIYTGQKLPSGTDMQTETLRAKIDNEGLMTLPSTTNAVIEADLSGKAVVTKEYLSTVRLKNYTVATLPAGVQGDTAYVTDATSPTYLGTLTGGGAVVCPVFYNGSAWVSH